MTELGLGDSQEGHVHLNWAQKEVGPAPALGGGWGM